MMKYRNTLNIIPTAISIITEYTLELGLDTSTRFRAIYRFVV